MNSNTLILIVSSMLLLQSGGAGCAQKTTKTKGMTCQLIMAETNNCSSTLVLEKGILKTDGAGQFELKGHYNACFHIEDVSIKGSYKTVSVDSEINFEFLGTQRTGSDLDSNSFPKTIGLMKLNPDTLEGTFVDIWASIRAQSTASAKKSLIIAKCTLM